MCKKIKYVLTEDHNPQSPHAAYQRFLLLSKTRLSNRQDEALRD